MKNIIFGIILSSLFLSLNAFAQNNEVQTSVNDLTAEEIFENNKYSVVSIWYVGNDNSYYSMPKADTTLLSGSGFIITSNGIVATNNHVIESFDSLLIKTFDGTLHNAVIVMTSSDNDIALLKIIDSVETEYPFVDIGNIDDIRAGQPIYAIGSPMGFEFSISSGIIAAIRTNEKVSLMDYSTYTTFEKTFNKVIQITASISPGNSGGPLFNSKGEAIGITTYSYGFYGNLNFAISIDNVQNVLALASESSGILGDSALVKLNTEIYNKNFRNGETYKSKVTDNWFYSTYRDTMKTYDTLTVKMDSLNHINLAKSENAFLKCIEIMPDSFTVYRELIDLYVSTDNLKMAEELYKKVKDRFQSDSLVNSLSSSLGSAYMKSKDYKNAITFYEKMLQIDTSNNAIRYKIADIYRQAKNYDIALNKFSELAKRDSTYIKSYIRIGQIYYENKNDFQIAKKYLLLAVDKNDETYMYESEYKDLYYILGMIAVSENKKTEAMMYYMYLKDIYTSEKDYKDKQKNLFKAIINMEE